MAFEMLDMLSMSTLTTELRLVKAARHGDQEAFASLVRQQGRRIYLLALRILRRPEDAEEVVQESLWKAYSKLEQFQGESRFSTWLARITLNEALMHLRKLPAREEISLEEMTAPSGESAAPTQMRDQAPNPEEACASRELRRTVRDAVARLQQPYRTVVAMRSLEEFTTAETAQLLGLSPTGVKTRLRRARLRLRQRLDRLEVPSQRESCQAYSNKGRHSLGSRTAFLRGASVYKL